MKKTLFLLSFLILAAIACKKEDNIPPVISSVNLNMNDTIRDNYSVSIEASDNNGVSSIELYANDSLIVKMEQLPFVYQLNTLLMKDGEYLIKVVAYDSEGNKTESSYKVIVQNAVVTFNLGSTFHNAQKFVISDEQGNVIKSGVIQGTGKVSIMPLAPFDKKAINIVMEQLHNEYTYLNGYVHVKRG